MILNRLVKNVQNREKQTTTWHESNTLVNKPGKRSWWSKLTDGRRDENHRLGSEQGIRLEHLQEEFENRPQTCGQDQPDLVMDRSGMDTVVGAKGGYVVPMGWQYENRV